MPFTKENAREFARIGNIARWSQPPDPDTAEPEPEIPPKSSAKHAIVEQPEQPDPFVQRTLNRVRRQVTKLLFEIDREADPQRKDRLAAAFSRLAEAERQLAGRPLPGSLKPSSPKRACGSKDYAEPEVPEG